MDKTVLKKYFSGEIGWGWGHQARKVFDFLTNAAEFCGTGVILDAGAGHQRYKPFFKDCVYLTQEHEAGIDFKGMKNVPYDLVSPLDEKIPLKDNCLDGVLSTSVVEHLRYPDRFFHEAYRVLAPGGKIFVNCPFVIPEHEVPFDFNRPTRYGLRRYLEDAGFGDISVHPTTSSTVAVCSGFSEAVRRDILKSDKSTKAIFKDALKKSPANALKKTFILIYAKLTVISVNIFCKLVLFMVDKGPHDAVNFPVGWIAVAQKPGKYDPVRYSGKEDFIKKCALRYQVPVSKYR